MRPSQCRQEGKEVPMQALQTMFREKYIQSVATARARCMMLLSLPFVQLKLVNGNDQDQGERETNMMGLKKGTADKNGQADKRR